MTQATRVLRAAKIEFREYPYTYLKGGGTSQFAKETGVEEHLVIKTLIMQDRAGSPLVVLMHGDREVSTRALARALGIKLVKPCDRETAQRHSGYKVGGTSPFGMRRRMPVYCEASIADLLEIYINGGRRGYIISMRTLDMLRVLRPALVRCARRRR